MKRINTFILLLLLIVSTSFANSNQVEQLKTKADQFLKEYQKTNTLLTLKSTKANPVYLDSITHDNGSKSVFVYDNNNNLVDAKRYLYNTLREEVVLDNFQSFNYNSNGDITLYEERRYDMMDGLVLKEKSEYEYNGGKLVDQIIWEYSFADKGMVKSNKLHYNYSGDSLYIYNYFWSDNSQNWSLDTYQAGIVDSEGRMTSCLVFMKDEDSGLISSVGQIEMKYRGVQLEEMVLKTRDEDSGELVVRTKSVVEFDNNNRITKEIEYLNYTGELSKMSEDIYTYDSDKLMKKQSYSQSFIIGTLSLAEQINYEYSNGQLVQETTLVDADGSGTLVENHKYQFSNNSNQANADLVLPTSSIYYNSEVEEFDMDYYSDGLLESVTFFKWSYVTETLVQSTVGTFHYSNNNTQPTLSNEAGLNDLRVGAETISGFSSGVYTYTVSLPVGTGSAPEVAATLKDTKASVGINQASVLPGEATVTVTAEDGLTQKVYIINFVVATSQSSIATLSDIKVDSKTVSGFKHTLYGYDVILPKETSHIPSVSATPTDAKATISVTQASELPGSASILVTAEDGTKAVYSVDFEFEKNNDATLSAILLGDEEIGTFSADKMGYSSQLPSEVSSVPVVSAIATDENATIKITQAENLNGKAYIVVTSEDGKVQKTYTVQFSSTSDVNEFGQIDFAYGPNPSNGFLRINTHNNKKYNISIFTLTGTEIFKETICGVSVIETGIKKEGIYLLVVKDPTGFTQTSRFMHK